MKMASSRIETTKKLVAGNAKQNAAIDIGLVLGTMLILKYALLSVEALWTYAGPISLLSALAVASWRLRQGGESWADLGLKRPKSWRKILAWTLVALVLTTAIGILFEAFISAALGDAATQDEPGTSGRFADLPGNTAAFIYWLAVAWIIGGFAEEMLFRGLLITRFETLFSSIPFGLIIAIIMPAALFGQQHYYYQGIGGAFATGGVALVSGILYLLLKRNLWPLTLSHGFANTIGLTLIYVGLQPAT
ncbi:CPBP family intramembrane glutamic endopeptidase [Parasphingorhabdus sp.]|uniref:CPBP family intramembrane glutamic endopeptidase n=1 Tax=Parasphingorhabdus sp. TaxID=2709688 RepID=UPI0032EAE1B2